MSIALFELHIWFQLHWVCLSQICLLITQGRLVWQLLFNVGLSIIKTFVAGCGPITIQSILVLYQKLLRHWRLQQLRLVIDTAREVITWKYLFKFCDFDILMLIVLKVGRRHNIPDFKPDSAYFDQISSLELVAREIHLWLPCLFDNLPYLLFWLFLKNLLCVLINQMLMKNPIRILSQQAPGYAVVLTILTQNFGIFLLKIVLFKQWLNRDLWFSSENIVASRQCKIDFI